MVAQNVFCIVNAIVNINILNNLHINRVIGIDLNLDKNKIIFFLIVTGLIKLFRKIKKNNVKESMGDDNVSEVIFFKVFIFLLELQETVLNKKYVASVVIIFLYFWFLYLRYYLTY
ncbi:hypothetical protein [Companilactobacillus sp. DQM5]|uniref:hypothetical protein n=1 Tax=Companilactobacillus sp. DQM5 TaxID=3463359 RepID=UPI004058CFC9